MSKSLFGEVACPKRDFLVEFFFDTSSLRIHTVCVESITELILERAGPVIFKTFLLELRAFRLIPVTSNLSCKKSKTRKLQETIIGSSQGLSRNKISIFPENNSWKHYSGSAIILVPTVILSVTNSLRPRNDALATKSASPQVSKTLGNAMTSEADKNPSQSPKVLRSFCSIQGRANHEVQTVNWKTLEFSRLKAANSRFALHGLAPP